MLPRARTLIPLVLPLLFGLGADAAAQVGRLGGTVAYATPGQPAARGVRVVAVGNGQGETRTDGNGNFVLVLRPGSYRVVAQAPGYSTYGVVSGYVRAYTDSFITPNPLYLVRGSNSMAGPMLSHTATQDGRAPTEGQNGFTLDTAGQNRGAKKFRGSVKYKDNGRGVVDARVVAIGIGHNGQGETKTIGNGNFELVLPEGKYSIVVQGVARYSQEHNVRGDVKANGESFIDPNPIYLIPTPPPRR